MTGVRVCVLPTLPFHAGMSMRLYAEDLVSAVGRVGNVDVALASPPFAGNGTVRWLRSRWIRYVAYPSWARRQRADLYHIADHGNAQLLLRLPARRTIVTCHDLYPIAIATGELRFDGAPTRASMVPTSVRLAWLRRAAVIVTVSKHTLEECRKYLGIPASRLAVAHEGVAPIFRVEADDGPLRAFRYRVDSWPDEVSVLHVGSNDPRKNVGAVLCVVARLGELTRRRVRLFKVGGRFGARERELIRCLGLEDSVVEFGQVPVEDLALMYRTATVLLYPSFYEGFCRPVVEALGAGLPVVASTGGAIPEVAGTAAALYDPTDVPGMAERILEIAENEHLRKEMGEAGREASRAFTWERHGEVVAEVYRSVASAEGS